MSIKNGVKSFFHEWSVGIPQIHAAQGAVGKFSTGFQTLANSLGISTAKLGAFLGVAAGFAAIIGIGAAIDKWVFDFDTLREKSDEAAAAYEEQTKKVEDLNGELETMRSRIDELQEKGSLTLTEDAELKRLQSETAELEKQLEFETRIQQVRARESAEAARAVLEDDDAYMYYPDTGTAKENGIWETIQRGILLQAQAEMAAVDYARGVEPVDIAPVQVSIPQGIEKMLDVYDELKQKQEDLERDKLELNPKADATEIEELNKQIEDTEVQITSVRNALDSQIEFLKEKTDEIILGIGEGEDTTYYTGLIDRWMAATDDLTTVQEEAADKQAKIDEILGDTKFSGFVDEIVKAAKDANGLTEEAFAGMLDEFPALRDAIEESMSDGTIAIEDFLNTVNSMAGTINIDNVKDKLRDMFPYQWVDPTEDKAEFYKWAKHSAESDDFEKWLGGLSDEQLLTIYYEILPKAGADWTWENVRDELDELEHEAISIDLSIDVQKDKVKAFEDSLSSIRSAISSQTDMGTISFDVFSAEGMEDYASALVRVNDGYQYNIEAVGEIVKAKAEERKAYLEVGKAQEQAKYLENAKEIEKLVKNYDHLTDAQREDLENKRADAEAMYANIQSFNVLSAEIDNATSAYQNWLNAQSAEDGGKMFDDVQTAIERIDDVLNDTSSDMYGKLGNGKFQADLDLILPDSIDRTDEDSIRSYIDDLKQRFVFNEDGSILDLNFDNVFEELKTAQVMTDDLHIAQGKTLDDFAEALGVSESVAMSIVDYLNEFILDPRDKITWTDEVEQGLGDILVEAQRSADALRQMDEYSDVSVTMDVSEVEDVDDAIAELDIGIATLEGLKAFDDIDPTALEYINNILLGLEAQKKLLEEPIVMRINANALTGDFRVFIESLQEYQNAKVDLELGINTDEAQGELASAVEKLKNLDYNDEVLVKLGIDLSDATDEDIQAAIDSLSSGDKYQVLAEVVPDNAWIDSEEAAEQVMIDAIINDEKYKAFQKEVEGYEPDVPVTFNAITNEVKSFIAYINGLPDIHKKIIWDTSTGSNLSTRAIKTSAEPSNTFVRGTAFAGGYWGAKRGGKYLVGELGREIVVDPHTGQWYTVGDNGAQFVNIPKGAIVFNHLQSEDLLRDGNTSGRARAISSARALASGNALLSGGGFNPDTLRERIYGGSGSNGSSNGNTSSSSGKSSNSGNNGSSSSDVDNWFERQYAYHNHLLNMEKEDVESYLKWLNKAYPKAYKEQLIELEDYYEYQEEVFEKLRELYEDSLDDIEHTISMLEHYEGSEPRIVKYLTSMMSSIEKEIAAARKAGLDDNDEYIQELQDRWWEYHDQIAEIEKTTQDEARDSLNELVEIRMDMLRQQVDDQKKALEDRLDSLEDEHDQKEKLLEDELDAAEKEHDQKEKLLNDELDAAEEARDKKKELLEKELDDIEKKYNKEKDLIDSRLDNLKEFYDKQRDMLQDQEDEEDYLKEQAEKRKAVSDIEVELQRLGVDDSAWAAKRKTELRQQLEDARNELNEFERDHARDLAQDQLDAKEDAQTRDLESKLDKLDEEYENKKNSLQEQLDANDANYDATKKRIDDELKANDSRFDDTKARINNELEANDNEYEKSKEAIENQISALEDSISSQSELRKRALEDLKNDNGTMLSEMLKWNQEYGTGIDHDIIEKWDNATSALKRYYDLYGQYYQDIKLKNQKGVTSDAPNALTPNAGDSWSDNKISQDGSESVKEPSSSATSSSSKTPSSSATSSSSKTPSNTESKTPTLTEADKRKVAAAIWAGTYGWGNGNDRGKKLSEVFGENNGIQKLVNSNVGRYDALPGTEYTYLNMRKKFKGYASGTDSAFPGLHQIDELGPEYLFTSEDGNKYRVFTGGEKVLNARATDFLYKFANTGGSLLSDMISNIFSAASIESSRAEEGIGSIRLGDIIIQGNTDEKTVSEIRRAQKDEVNFILKQFNKLKKQ